MFFPGNQPTRAFSNIRWGLEGSSSSSSFQPVYVLQWRSKGRSWGPRAEFFGGRHFAD